MIIKKKCPTCHKTAEVLKEQNLGGVKFTSFTCGHTFVGKFVSEQNGFDLIASNGDKPYPFQVEGAKLAAKAGRFLIGDEQGCGKTVQFLMAVHSNPDEFCPFLLVCKSNLRMQWLKETLRWLGPEFMPQILEGEKHYALPVKGYIVSLDLLRRFNDLSAFVKKLGIKTLGIDEVQNVKNLEASRTKALQVLSQSVPYMFGMSGTAIKNHAGEYFPILNMLRPDKFPALTAYERDWVDTYYNGYTKKYGGLKNPEKFKEFTSDMIIRRTRAEVQSEIKLACGDKPLRSFRFSDLGDKVENAYKAKYKEFQDYFNQSVGVKSFERTTNLLKYITEMRHITGYTKIDPCVSFVEDFITSIPERKITIFVHHKDIHVALVSRLRELQVADRDNWGDYICELTAEMDAMAKNRSIDAFKSNSSRVMVASTLVAGEGLNLQFCSDGVMMERQWNPANEEQAEGRFVRIGQLADVVNMTYLIAVGTVDETFSEIVEKKRAISANTLDAKTINWSESSLMQELTEVLAATGGKRWGW
jgi:SNF2 family DNA or RNA helicase